MATELDFGEMLAAQRPDPPTLRNVFGEDIELPAFPPALFVLFMEWLAEQPAQSWANASERLRPALDVTVGEGKLDQWIDDGRSYPEIGLVIRAIQLAYRRELAPEDRPPQGGSESGTSSDSGGSSKPTGNGSTAPTSPPTSERV